MQVNYLSNYFDFCRVTIDVRLKENEKKVIDLC